MILFWTLPTLKCIPRSCVAEVLCPTLKAPPAHWYVCCTDGLNMQRSSKMFGSHPICSACGNPQEGTRTGPPAHQVSVSVHTTCRGISREGQVCSTGTVGRICSCAEKRLGLLDTRKFWQTQSLHITPWHNVWCGKDMSGEIQHVSLCLLHQEMKSKGMASPALSTALWTCAANPSATSACIYSVKGLTSSWKAKEQSKLTSFA